MNAAGKCAALLTLLLCAVPRADAQNTGELYTLCSFYPRPGTCDPVYEKAAKDDHPAAASALATYRTYARYLKTDVRALNDEDKRYLQANQVALPDTLKPQELGGLHGVITDPALQADSAARLRAVKAFLARALQAHIYCVLHDCNAPVTSFALPPPVSGS